MRAVVTAIAIIWKLKLWWRAALEATAIAGSLSTDGPTRAPRSLGVCKREEGAFFTPCFNHFKISQMKPQYPMHRAQLTWGNQQSSTPSRRHTISPWSRTDLQRLLCHTVDLYMLVNEWYLDALTTNAKTERQYPGTSFALTSRQLKMWLMLQRVPLRQDFRPCQSSCQQARTRL